MIFFFDKIDFVHFSGISSSINLLHSANIFILKKKLKYSQVNVTFDVSFDIFLKKFDYDDEIFYCKKLNRCLAFAKYEILFPRI